MKNKLNDYIFKIENFLNKDFCEETVKQLEPIKWTDHRFVYRVVGGMTIEKSYSLKEELEVSYDKVLNKSEIMTRLHSAIQQYQNNLKFNWFSGWNGYSEIRFNKYAKNKTMAKHCDHIHSMFDGKIKGVPILSCLGILNDDYQGGEFIMFDNKHIELKAGDLLIFPSNFLYPHTVKPIKKGTRYSYISWVY